MTREHGMNAALSSVRAAPVPGEKAWAAEFPLAAKKNIDHRCAIVNPCGPSLSRAPSDPSALLHAHMFFVSPSTIVLAVPRIVDQSVAV
jgi:hypothetical protein